MTNLRNHLRTMARYHAWAARKLLGEHVAALPEADYRRDCGLFFKSVHGTLNHLLVGEHQLWFSRFALGISPSGIALDQEAEPDRALLAQRLLAAAQAWGPFIEALPEDRFSGSFNYTSSKGVPVTAPYAATLAHVFNHGTHHRGQITAALTMMGHACPELDLIYMLQAERRQQEQQQQ
uniref:Putative DinB family protein n=1 Tax=mine drainage metagenome TaxID=410659 RepID=E6PU07_9ZZZZ